MMLSDIKIVRQFPVVQDFVRVYQPGNRIGSVLKTNAALNQSRFKRLDRRNEWYETTEFASTSTLPKIERNNLNALR